MGGGPDGGRAEEGLHAALEVVGLRLLHAERLDSPEGGGKLRDAAGQL